MRCILLPDYTLAIDGDAVVLTLRGDWNTVSGTGGAAARLAEELPSFLSRKGVSALVLRAADLGSCDSMLHSVLFSACRRAADRGLRIDASQLPGGLGPMIDMALAVPPREGTARGPEPGFLERIGDAVMGFPGAVVNAVSFLGEVSASIARFLSGRASFSSRDMWAAFRECGADALPIVSLTSLLLGLILAFVSAMQLKLFGAEVYVASLVGVSMVRVMGPVLTGIVLSGRTGASFAAVIGSMQVNEEVDALSGFGIQPIDFLVLPRVLGLALMTPLLTLYADIAGIAGGFLVSVFMLGVGSDIYVSTTLDFLKLSYLWIGLLHALVFGFIISLCGCYHGIRCGRNASAVGRATTSAVVDSIVGIIISTSLITIILTVVDL